MRDQINDFTTSAAENFGSTSDRVLDAILDGNRQAVEAVVRTADQVAEQLPEVPWADRLPTPAEAGSTYLEWVEKAVEANRDFNHRVVEMLKADVTEAPAAVKEAATSAAKKATEAPAAVKEAATSTAKKATAKKPAAKKATTKKPAAKKAAAKKSTASA